MSATKRIVMLGFRLESNSHAPVCRAADFIELRGDSLLADLANPSPRAPTEFSAFLNAFANDPGVEVLPLSVAMGGAAGPVNQAYLDDWLRDALDRVKALAPIDGVYLAQHGAAIATGMEDPDGHVIAQFRQLVGSDVPIVVTLDPHANVSQRMADGADFMVAYQTNPHVDQYQRATEAAQAMGKFLQGVKTTVAFVKLPLIPPSIAQNTKDGPLGEHIRFGQSFVDDTVIGVGICSGFSVGDTGKNGMSVTVMVDAAKPNSRSKGETVAQTIAQRIWDERHRYDITMTSLDDATAMMLAANNDPQLPALCFADAADNPGGGGRGNTTFIFKAFLDAGCKDVYLGPFFDSAVAEQAHKVGVGGEFNAHFNSQEPSEYSHELQCKAKVLALHDGSIIGRRGILAGRSASMGKSALLQCGGVSVMAVSRRIQFCDPVIIECVGCRLDQFRGLVLKSRGHFRASVDEVFKDEQIFEVDVPGLTTPMLNHIDWQRVPRPIYPLDPDMQWSAST